jgi:hypothetical protein
MGQMGSDNEPIIEYLKAGLYGWSSIITDIFFFLFQIGIIWSVTWGCVMRFFNPVFFILKTPT